MVAGPHNVLLMDATALCHWARRMHRRSDKLYEDAMIGAIAAVHGLTVVTRNLAAFKALGVKVLNPFSRGEARGFTAIPYKLGRSAGPTIRS